MIPYGRQVISKEDIEAVKSVLESDFLTQGPLVPVFEEEVAKFCGCKLGVGVNSATSALHIACMALELGPNDWLWTSTNSFVASANCAIYCGAKVDFVDINNNDFCLSIEYLEEKLIQADKDNRLPKIVVAVHFAGTPCDMPRLHDLSQKYNFKIIEDASHAIGASGYGSQIGDCKFSDITVFSFHPVKIITTGEGGMALTNDDTLYNKMLKYRGHGITRDKKSFSNFETGDWYYEQIDIGFNYRLTDIQSALGLSQLKSIDKFLSIRQELRDRYNSLIIDKLPVSTVTNNKNVISSNHLYPIQVNLDETRKTRLEIFNYLRSAGIGVNVHYIPIHTQPYYKNRANSETVLPNAERYYERALSLPLHPSLTYSQQEFIVSQLSSIIEA